MPLSVLTDQERHLKIGKVPEQALVPMRGALGARWHIALVVGGAGITESHGQDGNSCLIVEDRGAQPQPVAQPITAGIIPRYPALMRFATWSLTDDQEPSGACQLQNGSGT